jgi:hypothetical protein
LTHPAPSPFAYRPDVTIEGKSTFNTTILLGKRDEPLIQLAARQMVELTSAAGSSL